MRNLWLVLAAMVSLSSGALFAQEGNEDSKPSTEAPAPVATEDAAQQESSNQ
jgi:hypothetical protein